MKKSDRKDEFEHDASVNTNNEYKGEGDGGGGFLQALLSFFTIVVLGVFIFGGLAFGSCLLG